MSQQNDNTRQNIDKEVNLMQYLVILLKHSRMLVYSSMAVVIMTMLILQAIPNKYTAHAKLMLPQQNMTLSGQLLDQLGGSALSTSASSGGGALGGLASGLLGLKSPGDLYVGILTGSTVFDRIIDLFKLRQYYRHWYSLGEPKLMDTREALANMVNIETGKDGLISIEVTDEDPQMAAKMAAAFMTELDNLLKSLSCKEAKDRLAFLTEERKRTIRNLTKAEEALQKFSEKSNVVQIDAQTKEIIEYIAGLRAAIDAKEVQIQILRQQATPFNYDVIRLVTELKGLKEKLRVAEAQGVTVPQVGDVMIATGRLPALGLEYLRLFRDVKYQESLYQLYCKLVELAHLDQFRDFSVLQVVDQPLPPPDKKSKPKRVLISLLVGVGFFIILAFLTLLYEFWQKLAQSESEGPRVNQMHAYTQRWQQEFKKITSSFKRRKNL